MNAMFVLKKVNGAVLKQMVIVKKSKSGIHTVSIEPNKIIKWPNHGKKIGDSIGNLSCNYVRNLSLVLIFRCDKAPL